MKKIITFFCFVSVVFDGYSQNLHLFVGSTDVNNTTIDINVTDGLDFVYDIDIHNTSTNAITYKITRVILNGTLGTDCSVNFCTGTTCYPPKTDTSWTMPQGAIIGSNSNLTGASGISTHFVEGTPATENSIYYKIFDVSNTNDSAVVTLHYKIATGINEFEKTGGSISNAFPNPSNTTIAVNYNLNESTQKGKIILYDMLGKVVKEAVLTDKLGVFKMDVSELNAGVYFYALQVSNKNLVTKKLIINSK
jgi:hypothetical protein